MDRRRSWIAPCPGSRCTMATASESPPACPTPTSSTCASAPPSRCCRARCGSRRWPRPAAPPAMPAVAVTDDANLFAAMQFCAAAKKAGVQPIVGAHAGPGAAGGAAAHARAASRRRSTSCCWSRTPPATRNLLRLLSRAWVGAEPGAEIRVGLDELAATPCGADLPHRRPGRAGRRCAAARRRQAARGAWWAS